MTRCLSIAILSLGIALSACQRLENVGQKPGFTAAAGSDEQFALRAAPFPDSTRPKTAVARSSLWRLGPHSLLGEQRAKARGDIVTVLIKIDDKAAISNSSSRSRSGSEKMSIPSLLGIPQRLNAHLPAGATMDPAVSTDSTSASAGNGAVKRSEKLTLRIAATVTDVLPNGILKIEGRQEVRVNFELRELLVSGYVRPADISRQNQITYDKIAQAHISYGGRGQISDVQQPRYGQQIADIVLPF